ncbi:L-serine dehydratase [Granulicella rosea]|uniref:L-serine ammonia-lyase n=1 Tax=Granulicella rosea TaxID=474952 RepID=A0A239MD11_9BACT|nr:L-serine ammonia-lyase [Granulicella rosea]SNT40062.1 L-serine dehydratase [Granulicella rosea]
MNTSLFELFKIGIGPSSSHTVGPMRAGLRFVQTLRETHALDQTASVVAELYGSLALTGVGHATDRATLLGLLGEAPDTVDPALIEGYLAAILDTQTLRLGGTHPIPFRASEHLLFHRDRMYPDPDVPSHPNGMRFTAYDATGAILATETFYSVGGGFILSQAEIAPDPTEAQVTPRDVPYPFSSGAMLLEVAEKNGLTIAELVLANESALLVQDEKSGGASKIIRPHPVAVIPEPTLAAFSLASAEDSPYGGLPVGAAALGALDSISLAPPPLDEAPETETQRIRRSVIGSILGIWQAMQSCTERGIATEGILPGGLNVRRRAPRLSQRISALDESGKPRDPLAPLDWVSLFAIAVNEENAAGGKVVTAPTNGAAGVIPAIAHYYMRFIDLEKSPQEKQAGIVRFFLTAAAIGILYKENASISGAEVGCQGEVGVACSMAAGGLVAALNGTNDQIEHAAEIAMEHNLGMTCDPIGGLVQIPCIERNAMGAVKAVNACRMAMHETEGHKLTLDQVIETMYRTGMDMQSRYKETSLAGLALNIIEC